jgi:peroxiredoxin
VKRFASAAALVCLFLLVSCNSNRPPKIGEKAPDFTITDSDHTVQLSQLHGKPVVLNFWATWCPPCIEEMPSLVQLQKKIGDKVTILAVSEDADDKAYKQFIRDHNIDLLTVRDAKNSANVLYGTFKFPETYVIDKDGVIRRKFIGPADWTSAEIVDYLNRM